MNTSTGNRKEGVRYTALVAAIGLALAQAQMQAHAQEASAVSLEEIVVTGTHIRGSELIGSVSQSIDAAEIASSGKSTLADFLREIPANFAGGVGMSDETQSGQDNGPDYANLTGGQGVNLRGLGALSTLVLINGRRVPASGQYGDFVDVSNIPAAAIERVEILQDGASAVYGSDAVGGVVNFILKRNLDRPISTLKFGVPTQGGGKEFTASQLFGIDWQSGNSVVGLEYYQRGSVQATDRDRYRDGSDFRRFGGVNWAEYTAHYSSVPNIFLNGVSGAVSAPVGASVPVGSNTALQQANLILHTDGSGNAANPYAGSDLLPEAERISLFGSFEQTLGDRFTLLGDARYTDRSADYDIGYGVILESTLPSTSPFYITNIAANLRSSATGNIAFGLVVDDRPETREVSVKSYGGQLGLRIELGGDWQLETAVSYGMEDQQRITRQLANISLSGTLNRVNCALGNTAGVSPAVMSQCAALGLQRFNPFSTDPMSAQQLDQLFGFEDLVFESYVTQGSVKADGALFDLPAGPVKLATGIDVRKEHMGGFLNWNTGSLETRSGPYTPTERDAVAAFAEFAVPLHRSVQLSAAGRYEEFSGTGDYDTFNPKFGVNWTPINGFKFRGSWGTSFHAPPMRFENDDAQPLPGGNAAFILPASYRGPCTSTLVDFNGIIGTPGGPGTCSFTVLINSGGAGPGVLKPEEATTWTFGVDIAPEQWQGFRASLSYFDIEVDERIQRIQSGTFPSIVSEFFATGTSPFMRALIVRPDDALAQALISSPKFLGTFGPQLANTAAAVQIIVNATQINIASLHESGLDFSASYDWKIGGHALGVFAYGTWLDTYELQAAPGLQYVDQLGKYSAFGSPVKLRTKQGASWGRGALSARLAINYTDDYECGPGVCFVSGPTGSPVANISPTKIDSWITADLNLGWDLSDWGGFAQGAQVSLLVNNVLDKEAPFVDGGTGLADNVPAAYDPNNATILGRTVALTLTKRW